MKHPRTSSQLGQAFIWFLATLAACCALLMIVYNVGQVSSEKERTTNAADAVAQTVRELFVSGETLQLLPFGGGYPFHFAEAPGKLAVGFLKRDLRIQTKKARQVYPNK